MSVSEWESAGWSERQMVVSLKKLPATCSTNQWATQLIYRSALALFLISLSVRLPPDGPGAEGRPPSHPRPPTHSEEEARLLQRLPAEVQLAGEQVFLWRGAKVQKSQQRFTRKKHRTRSVFGAEQIMKKERKHQIWQVVSRGNTWKPVGWTDVELCADIPAPLRMSPPDCVVPWRLLSSVFGLSDTSWLFSPVLFVMRPFHLKQMCITLSGEPLSVLGHC